MLLLGIMIHSVKPRGEDNAPQLTPEERIAKARASQAKLTSFFSPTSKRKAQLEVDTNSIKLAKKLESQEKQKRARLKDLLDRVAEYEKAVQGDDGASSTSNNIAVVTAEDHRTDDFSLVDQQIAKIIDEQACVSPPRNFKRPTQNKKWNRRPDNWRLIGEHFYLYGTESTLCAFDNELGSMTRTGRLTALKRWKLDWLNEPTSKIKGVNANGSEN